MLDKIICNNCNNYVLIENGIYIRKENKIYFQCPKCSKEKEITFDRCKFSLNQKCNLKTDYVCDGFCVNCNQKETK